MDNATTKILLEIQASVSRTEATGEATKEAVDKVNDILFRHDLWMTDHEQRVSTLEGGNLGERVTALEANGGMRMRTKVVGGLGVVGVVVWNILAYVFGKSPPPS